MEYREDIKMKKMRMIVAVTLASATLFSMTGCVKKIEKIDEDDLMDAFEDYFDWEEQADYRELENYEVRATNFGNADRPFIYDADYYLQGCGYNDEGVSAYVSYIIFEDEEDADEYFENYFATYAEDKKDVSQSYREGDWGFFIPDNDNMFRAFYFVDDMVMEVSAYDDDGIETLKDMLKNFGYPVK